MLRLWVVICVCQCGFSAKLKTSPLDGVLFGTWNVNSLTRWQRDKGDIVRETFENVVKYTTIFGIQEAIGFENYDGKWSKSYDLCSVVDEPEGRRGRKYRQFAVLVLRDEFRIVDSQTEVLPVDEVYGIKCFLLPKGKTTTKSNIKDHGILVYNVHLKAGKSKANFQSRLSELSRLVEEVKADKDGVGAQVILGDFNFAERSDEKDTWSKLMSTIDINFDGVLAEMQSSVQDAYWQGNGFVVTTPGGGAYDGIFAPGHVAGYESPNAQSALERFVPKNPGGEITVSDFVLSDHLPVIASLPAVGKVGTYNIKRFHLSSILDNDDTQDILKNVMDEMDIVGLQEIQTEPSFDRDQLLENMFPNHVWAAEDQYVCGCRDPYRLVESQLVDISNGHRMGFLCKFRKKRGAKFVDVCLLDIHLLNVLAEKNDVINVVQSARKNMMGDAFCKQATNVILGDFNYQIAKRTNFSQNWPNLQRMDCSHRTNRNWTFTALEYKTRLDHILVSSPGGGQVNTRSCDILSDLSGKPYRYKLDSWLEVSDHFPVFGSFAPL